MISRRTIVISAAITSVLVMLVIVGWLVGARQHPPRITHAAVPQAPSTALDKAKLADLAGKPDGVEALRSAWHDTADRAERVRIFDALGHSPDPRALEFLVEIASSDDALAAQAGATIGRMTLPGMTTELGALARGDRPVLVRANAILALGNSRSKDQVSVLVELLTEQGQPMRVRQEAALALGKLGGDAATRALAETLDALGLGAESEQLRISIVQALGTLGSPAAQEALKRHRARQLSATEMAFVTRALAHQERG